MRNKNGFTLIELLAVIVVLAVIIMIASNNVLGAMNDARKNALAIEGNRLIDAAKNAYQMDILNGTVKTGSKCYSLENLYAEYGFYSKGKKDNYTGSVLVTPDANGKIFTYRFWISNGSFRVVGDAGTTGSNATNAADASETCDTNQTS